MQIRILTPPDASAYFALRLEGLERAPRAFGRSAEEYRHEPLERVEARLAGGDSFTLGAFIDGELVGTVGFVRETGLKTRHKGLVVAVYVAERVQGRGVGKALMTDLLAHVRATPGVEQVMLAVGTTQDAARALYRSVGFEVFGLERRALKIDGEYVDEEHMVLYLGAGPS